jgi:hypothetical protein
MRILTASSAATVFAIAASSAHAQRAQAICEVSADYGATWSFTLDVWPGQRVDVRVRFPIVEIPAGLTVLSFSGVTFQPIVAGWRPQLGDSHIPFTFPGVDNQASPTTETTYQGRAVIEALGRTGRLNPFGAGGQHGTSASGLLTSFTDPDDILRFAGSKNSTPTTNVYWGVASAQQPPVLGINFNFTRNPTVFRYALTIGPRSTTARSLRAVVPIDLIADGRVRWYGNSSGTIIVNAPILADDIYGSDIHVRARCPADIYGTTAPDPRGPEFPPHAGFPDGEVTLNDLLSFLNLFEAGTELADLDDGSNSGTPDGGVTIDDLLFFLIRFEQGC